MINNAGINIRGPIEALSLEQFQAVQRTNVTGVRLACRAVAPHMKARRYGRVINVGSTLSLVSIPERTPYASSKGAVLQLTRTLALEWAPYNITVNAILPGPFATEMNRRVLDDPEKHAAFPPRSPWGAGESWKRSAAWRCSWPAMPLALSPGLGSPSMGAGRRGNTDYW